MSNLAVAAHHLEVAALNNDILDKAPIIVDNKAIIYTKPIGNPVHCKAVLLELQLISVVVEVHQNLG